MACISFFSSGANVSGIISNSVRFYDAPLELLPGLRSIFMILFIDAWLYGLIPIKSHPSTGRILVSSTKY